VAAAEPQPEAIQMASAAGFLRAQPVRTAPASGNQSLFSQFYAPPPNAQPSHQGAGKSASQPPDKKSGSLVASTQRIFQRRVVPGQTGLTLKDYRAN
jgi:hypothetical protein